MNSILNVLALIFVLGVGFNYLMKLIEEVKKQVAFTNSQSLPCVF